LTDVATTSGIFCPFLRTSRTTCYKILGAVLTMKENLNDRTSRQFLFLQTSVVVSEHWIEGECDWWVLFHGFSPSLFSACIFWGVCSTFNLGVNARGRTVRRKRFEQIHKSIGSAYRIQTPFSPWCYGRLLVLVAIDHQRVPFGIGLPGFDSHCVPSFLIIISPRHPQPSLQLDTHVLLPFVCHTLRY